MSSIHPQYALVIDPTLLYSTYLGGTDFDRGNGIAVDPAGNAYVTGRTDSRDFPTTPDSLQPTGVGIFVTKLAALGDSLIYSTYLGNGSRAYAIAVDSAGEAYVTGGYAGNDIPTTENAFQRDCHDSVFLTKLNAQGNGLDYSTCLGSELAGIYGPGAYAAAVDTTGNAYLTGFVAASGSFPTTARAFQSQRLDPRGESAFATVLDPAASGASSLVYSTYLGGHNQYGPYATYHEMGRGIAADSFGMIYVTGAAGSADFPVTPGAFLTINPASNCYASIGDRCPTAFVEKLNPRASGAASLIYSTFLGGSTGTQGAAVAVDPSGSAYVTGYTGEWYTNAPIPVEFPTTPGAFQRTRGSSNPGATYPFVTKFNAAGNGLVYSTLVGGDSGNFGQAGNGIALDSSGDAYVTGYTRSSGFPTTPDAFQVSYAGGDYDAFVTKLNATGSAPLIYSSYLGGATNDVANGIAVDSVGDAYLTGYTFSTDFPVTPFAFQPGHRGAGDAFVTKFPLGAGGGLSVSSILPNKGGNTGTVSPQIVGTGFRTGATVKLVGAGGPELVGNLVVAGSEGRTLTATFNLNGAALGGRDLVIANPNGTSVRLSAAFTVKQGRGPNVLIHKTGTRAVPAHNISHLITVTNVGNVDSEQGFVSELVEQKFSLTSVDPAVINNVEPLGANNLIVWNAARLAPGEGRGFSYRARVADSAPPGSTVVGGPACFLFPIDIGAFSACVATDPDTPRDCGRAVGACALPATVCCPFLACIPDGVPNPLFNLDICKRTLPSCLAAANTCRPIVQKCVVQGRQACDSYIQQVLNAAFDPSYLVGPTGVGDAQWVPGAEPLSYHIVFENEPTAGVPAQQVVVTNRLDPNADLSTLRLTGINGPDVRVPIPPTFNPALGMNEVTMNVDLRPLPNLFVNIDVKLDPSTRVLTWTFTSIDPTTGLPPEDAGIGFLPPGAEGGVSLMVKPTQGLATGTQISDQATVVFDFAPPESTEIWTNTLDDSPPTSQVLALPPTESSTCFPVEWDGTDEGAGVQDFTIFVSDNGRPYSAWLTNTTETSGIYNAQPGHTYAYYSQARDLVGNLEPAKTSPDTTTAVDPAAVCNIGVFTHSAPLRKNSAPPGP